MAYNFRGVLIFVIFVVDLAVTKISIHKNQCPYTVVVMWVLAHMGVTCIKMMGVTKTLWKHGQLFSLLASNDRFCHPADRVVNSNGFLARVINFV